MLQEKHNLPSFSSITGISGLSFNNTNEEKNLIKVLERLGKKQYIINRDVINNSITDFFETKGMTEEEFLKCIPILKNLGVVAIVIHNRKGAPNFPFEKEFVIQRSVINNKY